MESEGELAYVVGTFELPNEHASIGSMDVQLFPQQRPEILDGLIVLHDRGQTAFVAPPPLQAQSGAQPSLQTDVGEDVPIIWRPATRSEQSESGRTRAGAKSSALLQPSSPQTSYLTSLTYLP